MRWSEEYTDLDPTKHDCCAWIAPLTIAQTKLFPAWDSFGSETQKKIQRDPHNKLQWPQGPEGRFNMCGMNADNMPLNIQGNRQRIKGPKGCCFRWKWAGKLRMDTE